MKRTKYEEKTKNWNRERETVCLKENFIKQRKLRIRQISSERERLKKGCFNQKILAFYLRRIALKGILKVGRKR